MGGEYKRIGFHPPAFAGGLHADVVKNKQVIVVRADLKMSKGKLAAQVGHAAVSASELARVMHPERWRAWMEEGQCKVVVKVNDELKLLELERRAKELGLPTALIVDRGLTELPPNTITCLGIGPAPTKQVDEVTKDLPLL